jgi:hypothetical protein
LTVALLCGVAAWALMARPGYSPDFFHFWSAARTLLAGGDPYLSIPSGPLNPGHDPALYPLPAYLLLIPVAWLPLPVAGAIFMAVSAGLLSWGVARSGAARLPILLSAPFLLALSLGQWSPLMIAAALIPAVGLVLPAKPNLGLGVWVARPLLLPAILGAVLVLLSVAIMPGWPREWLANISGREEKFIPLLRPGGFLLLLALLAIRRPEGRLLLVMSVVPQALFFYDQLLLWLIPRTLRQSTVLSLSSLVLFLGWRHGLVPGDYEVRLAVPWAYAIYFPALGILLWNWYGERKASLIADR